MATLLWHLSGPVVAAVGVDGDAQPRTELTEVGVGHDVGEHASPLMHLGQRTHTQRQRHLCGQICKLARRQQRTSKEHQVPAISDQRTIESE